jgi:sugar-specific transcriptional regulator TrmB
LSQEQVLKMLVDFGFDQIDAQVYVYLAKKGMQKASDICKTLKLEKQQTYPSLKRLQSKGIVSSTIEHPARFSASPFEQVLDLFIKAKIEETQHLQKSKTEILANWQNLRLEENTSKFTVIEGRTFIFSRIQQMFNHATTQVLAITTVPTLAQTDHRGVFGTRYDQTSKSKIQFRFLVDLSEQKGRTIETLFEEMRKAKLNAEGRNPDLGVTLFPHMIVKDEDEALLFTKYRTEKALIEKDDVCLWTDCKPLVQAFTAMFEELWRNSTDIREKLAEIETGKAISKSMVVGDAKIAKEKYYRTLFSAKKNITIITSSQGLFELWKKLSQSIELKERGVAVKIMAPIMSENLEAAKQLSEFYYVKHIPPKYQLSTIIDGKELFQFMKPRLETQSLDSLLHFENTFYTNNRQYVQKMETMINEIWNNSSAPSPDNLRSLFGEDAGCIAFFPGPIHSLGAHGAAYRLPFDTEKKDEYPTIVDDDPSRQMTEQDILNEIVAAQKNLSNDQIWKIYSSQAVAVIHLPDFFKLPAMLFRAQHFEKYSAFGEQDVIIISLWLETSKGHLYVPVAVLGTRPQAQAFWEKQFLATPTIRNFQLASKEELQIRVHGNTFFAGWTVPIPLYPSEYILPPSCILMEGYGEIKTNAYKMIKPTGEQLKIKQNGFDAFVTFMNPSSKYSGPGTDGFIVRDFILETTPKFYTGGPTIQKIKVIKEEGKIDEY